MDHCPVTALCCIPSTRGLLVVASLASLTKYVAGACVRVASGRVQLRLFSQCMCACVWVPHVITSPPVPSMPCVSVGVSPCLRAFRAHGPTCVRVYGVCACASVCCVAVLVCLCACECAHARSDGGSQDRFPSCWALRLEVALLLVLLLQLDGLCCLGVRLRCVAGPWVQRLASGRNQRCW